MAAAEIFADQPSTTVSSGGTTAPAAGTSESWTVASSASFPAASSSATPPTQFHVVDSNTAKQSEIIAVTNISGATWTVTRGVEGTTPVAHSGGFTIVQVVTSGYLNTVTGQYFGYPWQFYPENFGAKRDGAFLYDANMTNGSAVLTTAGLPAPAAPTVNHAATGGTVANGTYLIQVTYVNRFGETLASSATSVTTTGSNISTITVTTPGSWTNATGYYVYCTQAGGGAGTETRQQSPGSPTQLQVNYVISAPPTNTGAAPPGANTSASAPFTAADVGKSIIVLSAGGFLNVPLSTTIASYQSSSQVTLTASATRSVTGYGAVYATDDTSAIQQAINAAVAYAQTAGKEQATGEVIFSDGIYGVAGALTGTYQNAQITIPYVDPYVGPKVNLKLTGAQEASGPVHWEQPNPQAMGTTLASFYYSDNAPPNPKPAVIGGPVTSPDVSNMRVVVDGINVLVAYRTTISGLDLYEVGQADIKSFAYFAMARTLVGSAGGWPPYQVGDANASPWQTFGYRSPTCGNNAQNDLDRLTVYGPYYGFIFADHFAAASVKVIFCFAAAVMAHNSGANIAHHCVISSLVAESCGIPVYAPTDGTYGGTPTTQAVYIPSLQVENFDHIIDDTSNSLQGEVRAESLGTTGVITNGKNGASNIRLIWEYQALGAVASPPGVPGSTTAYTNQFWRDAVVIISGGSVSVIAVDGLTTGLTSGPVFVRDGGTITLTYSSAPTWQWVLA